MLKISVLVSGGGTNLQALIDAQNNGVLSSGKIVQVISSRNDAYALVRAEKAGIETGTISYEHGCEEAESKLLSILGEHNPEVIVLAGFVHILTKNFLENCKAQVVNVHPSLIPSFCGRGFYGLKVHEAVIRSGVKVTGATVHLVNEIPDGGKILSQKAVDVLPDDTPERLQHRVMENAEWIILPRAVEDLCRQLDGKVFASPVKYPGRGIIVGVTPSGRKMFAYFIMGRSSSSRARVFERSGDELVIRLTKQDPKFDPSLILYVPVRVYEGKVIVTNGDQTDTIFEALKAGKTFADALRTREYEPDAPHYTPRISAIITESAYVMSILKRSGKYFYEYSLKNGTGHLIHTYNHDVMRDDVLPSFMGEPREVKISENMEKFADDLWNELDDDNKVSLYVRYYDADMKAYQDKLFNKGE